MSVIIGDRLRLRGDRIMLVPVEETVAQTAAGIWIPEQAQDRQRYRQWQIHGLGPDCYDLEIGDRVVLKGRFAGEPWEWQGAPCRIVRQRENHIIAVIRDE